MVEHIACTGRGLCRPAPGNLPASRQKLRSQKHFRSDHHVRNPSFRQHIRSVRLPWKNQGQLFRMPLRRRPAYKTMASAASPRQSGADDTEEAKEGLLASTAERSQSAEPLEQQAGHQEDDLSLKALSREIPGEIGEQAKLALPLALGLIANYSLGIISMSYVGKLGTSELAAAALGSSLYSIAGKITMMGLCGGLDTYASQAAGSGRYSTMGTLYQKAVLFLLLHAIPISAIFFGLSPLLRTLGQPADLTQRVGAYLMALLPAVWVDAVYRPLNRILVAQGITAPQMWIGGIVALQHVAANQFFIHTLGCGYLGAAYATAWSNLLAMLLLAAYVRAMGLQGRVWSSPGGGLGAVMQGWLAFSKLAYASAAMKVSMGKAPLCIESWSFSLCTVVAGWLPDPHSAVAAISVAFNLYGILFMGFSALALAVNTRVGNALGAGKATLAKLAALAPAVSVPFLWAVVAAILVTPACQRLLLALFTSKVADELLLQRMRNLLYLVVILELFDGGQTVMSGVVSGAGKQARGSFINVVAYWVLALPAALLLAFPLAGGVEGLYSGMVLGPLAQCCCYAWLIARLRWGEEAEAARRRVLGAAL